MHRLGNLTLLTGSLNSKVSNGPWTSKRKALLEHNTIKLTGRLIEQTQDTDWSEALIDQRTASLIDTILKIWPVPEGHKGQVVDPQTKVQDWVEIKHLIEAGLLAPGDKLVAAPTAFAGVEAVIGDDARIHVGGKKFATPSGAGNHVRKKVTNGWYFWALPDGRRLRDVRAAFLSAAPADDAQTVLLDD